MTDRYARIEAARSARLAADPKPAKRPSRKWIGRYAVVAVNERTGERRQLVTGLSYYDANMQAGYRRDTASDRDVDDGWNYLAIKTE